ncbi:DUF4340 domain-containing protein [Limisphaera sp. VF-2]|jgi:hypothetical protein|uniref:DUF4340 domain-containing protein n=1 Tax=Limisphaera sp. VF-2 TaxID=3400418 RepID=UPI00177A165D|nr:DUF4340 domain-containing protein [Limisphaera sp.]
MNRKQLALLLGLVVVLGGAGYWLYRQESRSWQQAALGAGSKVLPDLAINDIAHVRIRRETNELNLVKKDGLWRVRERGDYPANFNQISEWILKASELKAVQVEEVGPSQMGRLSLLPPGPGTNTATLVEFLDAQGKPLAGLLLGKTQARPVAAGAGMEGDGGFPVGRFVMSMQATGRVALISDTLSGFEPRPEQWIAKDFFKVERPRRVEVRFAEATNSWAIRRETESAPWQLVDAKPGEQLDSAKATSATSGLSWPSFLDVLPKDTPPGQVGLEHPVTVTVETFDQFTYTLHVSPQTNQSYYVTVSVHADLPQERTPGADEKPEDKERLDKEFKEKQQRLSDKLAQEKKLEGWIYQVSTWTLDALLKPRREMLTASGQPEGEKEPESTSAVNGGDADRWVSIPELE